MDILRHKGTAVIAPLVAGLALRAAFVHWQPFVVGDSLLYGNIAANILHNHQFAISDATGGVRPTLIRLPGYPLFLAACFSLFGTANYTPVLWLQVIMDLGTCWLIGATAARIGGARAGNAALWLAALCPFTSNYTAAPLTETPVLFTIAAAFYALCRWRSEVRGPAGKPMVWAAVLGASTAFSVLLRPDQGLLALVIVAAMLWIVVQGRRARRRKESAGIALICLLVAAPLGVWAARNWRVFHVVQPLAPRYATDPEEMINYGFQRWYRTWGTEFDSTDRVYWNYGDQPVAMSELPARACDDAAQCAATTALLDDYNDTTTPTPEIDAKFAELAKQRIAAHPFRYYVEMPTLRLADMLLRPRAALLDVPVRWWEWRRHPRESFEEVTYALLNLAYFALSIVGLWRWKRAGWLGCGVIAAAMVDFVLLRCALLLTIDNSEPRYTLEFFPLLMVWAGMLWRRRSERSLND